MSYELNNPELTPGDRGEEPDEISCPMCGGPPILLGGLGRFTWYRCRDCGTDYKHNYKAERAD